MSTHVQLCCGVPRKELVDRYQGYPPPREERLSATHCLWQLAGFDYLDLPIRRHLESRVLPEAFGLGSRSIRPRLKPSQSLLRSGGHRDNSPLLGCTRIGRADTSRRGSYTAVSRGSCEAFLLVRQASLP